MQTKCSVIIMNVPKPVGILCIFVAFYQLLWLEWKPLAGMHPTAWLIFYHRYYKTTPEVKSTLALCSTAAEYAMSLHSRWVEHCCYMASVYIWKNLFVLTLGLWFNWLYIWCYLGFSTRLGSSSILGKQTEPLPLHLAVLTECDRMIDASACKSMSCVICS